MGTQDKVEFTDRIKRIATEVKWYENAKKKQGAQGMLVAAEGRWEEDGKMEVDEEIDSKKSWIKERRICKGSSARSRNSQACRRIRMIC